MEKNYHGLEDNYILTDSIEKAYRRYCYSNLKKLVEKGLYTELVKPEKVIQCVRKDENVNIISIDFIIDYDKI